MRWSRVFAVLVAGSVATVAIGLTTAAPAGAATIGSLSGAGPRPGATRLSFKAADGVQAQVDVGSGNLYVTVRGVALPGVQDQVQLGAFYNSAASDASAVPRLGRGWGLDYTGDIRLVSNADFSATYYGPGGLTGVFTRASSTAATYTSAAGFKSDLVKTSTGWTLTERDSRTKRTFNTGGKLTRVEDRNGNATTVAGVPGQYSSFDTVTITSPAGPTSAREATVQTDAADTEIWQSATGSQNKTPSTPSTPTATPTPATTPSTTPTQLACTPVGSANSISGKPLEKDWLGVSLPAPSRRVSELYQGRPWEDLGGAAIGLFRCGYGYATS